MSEMVENEFGAMVTRLAKDPEQILSSMTVARAHMIHMVMGIMGEAGELLDGIKKSVIYNKPFDRANIIEELGDMEFYMKGLRDYLKISRDEVLLANMTKLNKRYPVGGYTDADAQKRADKEQS